MNAAVLARLFAQWGFYEQLSHKPGFLRQGKRECTKGSGVPLRSLLSETELPVQAFSETEALYTLRHKLAYELLDKLPNMPFVPTKVALKIRSYPHAIALYHHCALFYIVVLLNLNRDFVRLPTMAEEEKRNISSPSSYLSTIRIQFSDMPTQRFESLCAANNRRVG